MRVLVLSPVDSVGAKLVKFVNCFGICAEFQDVWLIKLVQFGILNGTHQRGRPHERWTDDVMEW